MSEQSDVTSPTLAALSRLPGVWAMRVHSGSARGGKQRLAPVGTPDLLAVIRGVAVFLECKAPKKNASPGQIEQHRRIRLAGADVVVVRSVHEALGVVREILSRKETG